MSFPSYRKYRHTDMEWIGDLPDHWQVRRVRWLFDITKRIAGELGYDVFSITQEGIRVKDLDVNDGQMSLDYSKYQIVEVGDFAMNPMDLLTGGVDIARSRGVTSPDYRVVELRDPSTCLDSYFLYVFKTCYQRHIFYGYGQGSAQLGRWRLPTDRFRDFVFPLPPILEQRAIASFLDVEIGRIDALVGEQRRLIELLKEKRQAVISHAVTKGLNPDAPIKPSGVEWLGDVPAHWSLSQIRRWIRPGTSITYGIVQAGPHIEDGVPYIRTSDMVGESLPLSGYLCTSREIDTAYTRSKVRTNDLVVAIRATLGKGLLVPPELEGANLTQGTAKISPGDGLLSEFLFYAFNSKYCQTSIRFAAKGTTFLEITLDALRRIPIAVPPLDEQRIIASFLRVEVARFGELIAAADSAIRLLQERRTALIAAAVEGQIDVRGLAAVEVA